MNRRLYLFEFFVYTNEAVEPLKIKIIEFSIDCATVIMTTYQDYVDIQNAHGVEITVIQVVITPLNSYENDGHILLTGGTKV